jgi:pyruvate/2-oxoglutarate/acetoin dehydrogenase E1 component
MSMRKMSMAKALNEALDYALASDQAVFVMGEDIVDPGGGTFKVTAGLSTKFGRERIRETPISEQAIVGAGIGAAMIGMKPVVEIMIADFYAVCLDQVANHAAKLRYMSGGRTSVPLTIRGAFMGGSHSAAQHSSSVEAWLAHTPGLKVAIPSTPADAKGLLLTAIHDPDPVVILEPAMLYSSSGLVPDGDFRIPLGSADVKREGADVTIITYGAQVRDALAVADELADGISVEVVDLRWITPWDIDTVLASVSKTKRAIVVHQAVKQGGFGGEVVSVITEQLWGVLKAPILRVAAQNTPVPFSATLESAHLPSRADIADAVRRAVK